ncbi:MAG: hypothetical protein IPH37_19985 [Burkholderiales bacterium]|nr:hypothetical protein [Burkholderiales bacterium]
MARAVRVAPLGGRSAWASPTRLNSGLVVNRTPAAAANHQILLPRWGWTFQINSEDANDHDLRLLDDGCAAVDGRTAQGPYLGMTEDAAMPIIRAGYKVGGSIAVSWGKVNTPAQHGAGAETTAGAKTQSISFTFRESTTASKHSFAPRRWSA